MVMLDRDKLGAWIQPQHLEQSALARYRQSFESHPAHVVVLKNFLQPDVADRLSQFLSKEAEFKVTYGLYSTEEAVSEENWRSAADDDRLFKLGRLVGAAPQFQRSPNALTYLQFRMTFFRPELKAFFEEITGMALGNSDDFGAQSMVHDDLLRPHSDDNRNREIALVIYLAPGWKAEFGGQLRVVHLDGENTVVEAEYNSIVVFNVHTHSAHVVEPVRPGIGATNRRLTIGGWYHRPL
jgi:Rps23 Pro-64 3,4-dihydroxylase Tpa1-like proline 4-hydroxylase